MKNDWQASDPLIRNSMNQPYWLVSGTIAGTGDAAGVARVFVGQGIMRWGCKPNPAVNTALTSTSFGPVQANNSYAIFIRRDGSTFMVSGSASLVTLEAGYAPPRWDAEPIGIVQVGSSADTAHFHGPWDSATTGLAIYEQRGQYNAIVSARQRAVYVNTAQGAMTPGTINATVNGSNNASGIAFLSLDDSTNQMSDGVTIVQATVTWVPSGALGFGGVSRLAVTPNFVLWRADDYRTSNWAQSATDAHTYVVAQDPDNQSGSTAAGGVQRQTTTVIGVNTRGATTGGYVLGVYNDPAVSLTTGVGADNTWTAIRIFGVTFIALPGNKGSSGTEQT